MSNNDDTKIYTCENCLAEFPPDTDRTACSDGGALIGLGSDGLENGDVR